MSEQEVKSYIERAKVALPHLLNYQQADMDGIMVNVSRQAIEEVAQGFKTAIYWYGEAIEQRDEAEAEIERLRYLVSMYQDCDSMINQELKDVREKSCEIREAFQTLVGTLDLCPRIQEPGATGMTVENQLLRTHIMNVPAVAVEDAREILDGFA